MFKLDIENKKAEPLNKVTYAELNLQERYDIQEWIADNPKLLGVDNLIIIAKEYPLPSGIRLDLLAIDNLGNLVVIELKRDNSGRSVDLQAIKYASYCSVFTNDKLYEIFADYLATTKGIEKNIQKAKDTIIAHIGGDDAPLNEAQRIILVAREFTSDVVSSVMWLRDYGIDITCVRLEALQDPNIKNVFLDTNIIIPTPEARDYIISKEKKEKAKQSEKVIYSLDIPTYSDDILEQKLIEDFIRPSDLTPKLIAFIKILLENESPIGREEIKQQFFRNYSIGTSVGHAGTHLSNVSSYLTKPNNGHLRKVVSFESENESGSNKTNFILIEEYKNLVQQILQSLDNSSEA